MKSDELRSKVTSTRLTPTDANRLREKAQAVGLTDSEYVHLFLIRSLDEPADSRVILAYLELLTEDVARLETVITFIVANLKAGHDVTTADVEQLAAAAARHKKGYASARLKAAALNAANGQTNHA